MLIGDRLREVREQKKFSQGDVEKRTGLLRCYISRVENGHTVPSVETIEKMARALEIPMYQLFYDCESTTLVSPKSTIGATEWGSRGRHARLFLRLRRLLGKVDERNRRLLLAFAEKVARRRRKR